MINNNNNNNNNVQDMNANPNPNANMDLQNPNMYNTNIDATRTVNNMQATGLTQNPYVNQQNAFNQMPNQTPNTQSQSLFTNGDFVKGALIGAAVTFLLTNKTAQNTIFKAASKGSELFQAGMEEIKERFEDAKAQMDANK